SDVDRERPSPVAKSPGHVKPQNVEDRASPKANRRGPALPCSLEGSGPLDPHGCREWRQCDRSRHAAESAQGNRDKGREESILDPLARTSASDEFVKIVTGASRRSTEVDEVLRGHSVAREDRCRDRMKEEPARSEGLLKIERQRRSQKIARCQSGAARSADSAH